MTVQEMAASCRQPNREVERAARERWDSIAKPLRGLGFLEDAVVKISWKQDLEGGKIWNINK